MHYALDLTTIRKQMPWSTIEPFITSAISLAGKANEQPSMKEVLAEISAIKASNKTTDDKVTIVKNVINNSPSGLIAHGIPIRSVDTSNAGWLIKDTKHKTHSSLVTEFANSQRNAPPETRLESVQSVKAHMPPGVMRALQEKEN